MVTSQPDTKEKSDLGTKEKSKKKNKRQKLGKKDVFIWKIMINK